MALLDTHAVIEELIASGVKKKQAEIFTKAINQSNDNLVTKTDMELALIDLKQDVATIKTDLNWGKSLLFIILVLIVGLWFK